MPTRKPSTTTLTVQPDLFEATDERSTRARGSRVRYFAYGSNADQEQMRTRCPSARLLGTATLRDHCMVFAGHSASRGGAVATVFACDGFVVPGALYSVTRSDLAMLDRFEGVPWMYVRAERWVQTDVRRRRATVYWLRDEHVAAGIRRPAPAYLGQITLAYRRLGIPPDSISLALAIAERAAARDPVPRAGRPATARFGTAVPGPGPAAAKAREQDKRVGILRARARVRREFFGSFSRLVYELVDGPHAGIAYPVGDEAVEGEEVTVRYRPGAAFACRVPVGTRKKSADC